MRRTQLRNGSLLVGRFHPRAGVSLTKSVHKPSTAQILFQPRAVVEDVLPSGSAADLTRVAGPCPRPLISRVLSRVLLAYPDIRLKAIEAYSGEVENMLADGRADIGIFNRYRPKQRDAREAVFSAPLHLVGRAGAPALGRQPVRLSAMSSLPLVLPARPNGMRSYLDEICSRRGLTLNVVLEATSGTLIREVVLHCDVFSLLPYHAVADEIRAGALAMAPIKEPGLRQTAFVDATRKHPLSNASRAVLKVVLEEMRMLDIAERMPANQ